MSPRHKAVPTQSADLAKSVQSLTKEELAEADKRWEVKKQYFNDKKKSETISQVQRYYELGQFCHEMRQNPKLYGNRTGKDVALEMKEDVSTLTRAMQFASKWSQAQFTRIVELNLSWADIKPLLPLNNLTKRNEIELKLSKGELTQIQAERECRDVRQSEKTSGKAKDQRGGIKVKTTIKAVGSMTTIMLTKLSDVREVISEYKGMKDASEKAETAEMLKGLKKDLGKLGSEVEKVCKLI